MNYLQRKKLAFMSIVNKVKRFIKSISGVPPISLEDCVDSDSLIDYKLYGNSVQDGEPTPEAPVEVVSVGEKTVNLLPYPYYESTKTLYGVTFTDNGDCTISVSGTAIGYAIFTAANRMDIKSNTQYCFSGIDDCVNIALTVDLYDDNGSNVKSFVATKDSIVFNTSDYPTATKADFRFKRYDNTEVSGTIRPQLQLGTTATPYEPYNKYKVPVVARGKNLLSYPYYYNSRTLKGITITVNDDGTIILNGTGEFDTARVTDFYLLYKSDISVGTYTLSGCPTGGGTYSYRLFVSVDNYYSDGKSRYYNDIGSGTSIDVKENCTITIAIRFGDEIGTVDNLVFKPQLELGSTATDYEPYHAPITTNLYLDEPLRSQYHSREKQWYYDKVDYKTGTIIRNLAEKTFVGAADENWARRVDESDTKICFFIRDISNNTSFAPDNVMCDKFVANYTYASNVNTDLEGVSLACTTNIFYIGILKSRLTDAGLTVDLDGFKTWLSQNPVTITYILKEPTEETISIPKLPTIKGTTIYEIGTSLNASNMEATYYSTSKGG